MAGNELESAEPQSTSLAASLSALHRLLEQPKTARRTLFGIIVIHTGLLAYSAYVHSPTLSEPGHLVAGLSYWKFGRFDVYSVNPPLVKMIAGLPVIAVGYVEDWHGFDNGPGARPEIEMGRDFIAANGKRSLFLFRIARWACIPFSWLGAIVCFLWARDLFGRPAGVLAAAIWSFEPNILAHTPLITSDAAGTALGAATCYTFWRWLKVPTWPQATLTGVMLGLAELAKTTLILFYPLWGLMWLAYRLWPSFSETWNPRFGVANAAAQGSEDLAYCKNHMGGRDWLREGGMLLVQIALAVYILNLGYGFEGSQTPLMEYKFVSDLFSGANVNSKADAGEAVTMTPGNRFADSWVGKLPLPLPSSYLVGIDLQQKDFEHYSRPSYLGGEWREHGSWYYYLYAGLIKIPLGMLVLGASALVSLMIRLPRKRPGEGQFAGQLPASNFLLPAPSLRDGFILWLPPLAIFVVVSSKTGFSEHFRYVLPCFPFAFVGLAGAAIGGWRTSDKTLEKWQLGRADSWGGHTLFPRPLATFFGFAPPLVLTLGLTTASALWAGISSLWVYPHSLSYFNEFVGGPMNGPRYLLGSNVDWGQDLLYLKDMEARGKLAKSVYVAAFTHYAPNDIGISRAKLLPGPLKRPSEQPQAKADPEIPAGDYAISVNILAGFPWLIRGKTGSDTHIVGPEFLHVLYRERPSQLVGYTMKVFEHRCGHIKQSLETPPR